MSHQSTEYSPAVSILASAIKDMCGESGLGMADAMSSVAEVLLEGFVELRNTYGDAVLPEMRRYAERINQLADCADAQAMHALSEHLADAHVPGTEQ